MHTRQITRKLWRQNHESICGREEKTTKQTIRDTKSVQITRQELHDNTTRHDTLPSFTKTHQTEQSQHYDKRRSQNTQHDNTQRIQSVFSKFSAFGPTRKQTKMRIISNTEQTQAMTPIYSHVQKKNLAISTNNTQINSKNTNKESRMQNYDTLI